MENSVRFKDKLRKKKKVRSDRKVYVQSEEKGEVKDNEGYDENKENIPINIHRNEDRIEEGYTLLRKKLTRQKEEQNVLNFPQAQAETDKTENINLPQSTSHLTLYSSQAITNFSRRFSIAIRDPQEKYSFNADLPKPFASAISDFMNRYTNKIILTIIKSNVNLNIINTTYVINERGIDCSMKTHHTDFISIGRQQINDQGIRPNDIMLFPTDPSISRSHFKIFHKQLFVQIEEYRAKCWTMLMITHSRLGKNMREIYSKVTSEEIFHIMKYICPKLEVPIEDNGTIYGTYVRIKSFELPSFLVNFYISLVGIRRIYSEGSSLKEKYCDNFGFMSGVENYIKYNPKGEHCECLNVLKGQCRIEECLNSKSFDELNQIIKGVGSLNLALFPSHFALKTCNKLITKSERLLLAEHNMLLNDHPNAVFLCNAKNGFIIPRSGSLTKIFEYFQIEAAYSQMSGGHLNPFLNNTAPYNPIVEVISIDKIFDCQKLDASSQCYKAYISKDHLVSLEMTAMYDHFSGLHLIVTSGDPCGVMNRGNEVLFLMHKSGLGVTNPKSFSFNYFKGFLLGNNSKCAVIMNSESDVFVYFLSYCNTWMITDLTRFVNPAMYFSENYFGLWICTSPDKKMINRFSSQVYYLKSGDEIKVSETVMKVNLDFNHGK